MRACADRPLARSSSLMAWARGRTLQAFTPQSGVRPGALPSTRGSYADLLGGAGDQPKAPSGGS
eukprot:11587446-Prorocentrum_lima.AAC.1